MRYFLSFFIFVLLLIPSGSRAQQFGSPQTLSWNATLPTDIKLADLDSDGDLDFINPAINQSSTMWGVINWWENDGTGDVEKRHVIYDGLLNPRRIEMGDLNNDGSIDILYYTYQGSVHLQYNNGQGQFADPITVISDLPNVTAIDYGDMDGDGDIDFLVTSVNEDAVLVILSEGGGLFTATEIGVSNTWGPRSIMAHDVDMDGDLDVVCGYDSGERLKWFENEAGLFDTHFSLNIGLKNPGSLTTGDVDGDGLTDILCAYNSIIDNDVVWFKNLGAGNYESLEVISSTAFPKSLEAIDLDSDGDLDVLFTSYYYDSFYWCENDGNGNFADYVTIYNQADGVTEIHVGDIDGDGDLDIAVAEDQGDRIEWFDNDGTQDFSGPNVISNRAEEAWDVITLDTDGDGDLDVISTSVFDDKLSFYENLGGLVFAEQVVISTAGFEPKGITTLDADNDGDQDIITAHDLGSAYRYYQNFGGNTFSSGTAIGTPSSNGSEVLAADLNNDGNQDLLACKHSGSESVTWFVGNGNGSFSQYQVIAAGSEARSVEAADLDGDGDLDVIVAFDYDDILAWYENNGSGFFGAQQIISDDAENPQSIEAGDIDEDGDMDLIVSSLYAKVRWYVNDGTGSFDEEIIITDLMNTPQGIALEDLDGDGKLDILAADRNADNVVWIKNLLPAGFSDLKLISERENYAKMVHAADLDGDGYKEVLYTSNGGDKVSFSANEESSGCMDPIACNYDSEAIIDDMDCCYSDCGCTYPGADNYDPLAICNDGSCEFSISGQVFFDENENGVLNTSENGLEGRTVILNPQGIVGLTNNQGGFLFQGLAEGEYVIALEGDSVFPNHTTDQYQIVEFGIPSVQAIEFGISDEELVIALQATALPLTFTQCDALQDYAVYFSNEGNQVLDIVIAIDFDEFFGGYEELPEYPIDSVSDNSAYFSLSGLAPGESGAMALSLQNPPVSEIGVNIELGARVWGYDEIELQAFATSSNDFNLLCAYDPNDKQVFPAGYTEAHYIPEDDFLEYLIRFQNTGNAPATDVIIRDTLDDGLDISSFQLVANSHSVFTTVDPESREVEFYFQDIQLPDSVNNEPESHGLVSFKVRPEAGLPLLTELNNTAAIYFDNNPPIITNTTWCTIYNCSLFEVEFTQDGAILTASEGDSYQWYLDGEPIEGATAPIFEAFENGDYAVEISNDFPCSELTSSIFIAVDGIEELASAQIVLFPNPMTSSAILNLGELRGDFALEIFDIKGQLMRQQILNIESGILNLARGKLSSGQYLLRLISEGYSFELRFVIE